MDTLFTFLNSKITPISSLEPLDDEVDELIQSEFGSKVSVEAEETKTLISNLGFCWDKLSIPGYLTFKPYAAFMEEAARLYIWNLVSDFCQKNRIPLHRISGGDLYSLDNELMKRHVQLAEQVGMYGDGLLKATGNMILRFSGCSNKLSQLKESDIENASFPFGIFEISDSYRFEAEDQITPLVRNRFFHLPELHIINKDITQGLEMLLKGHKQMTQNMDFYGLDFVMLFSTTQKFVSDHEDFIQALCLNSKHPPVINIVADDTCENGIVFDVEYKAKMSNGILLEIGTFQIDTGTTDFAYGIKYQGTPVTTVHAVFFASSVERTIFTFCDISNSTGCLPNWLTPIHCRLIPAEDMYLEKTSNIAFDLANRIRVEVDDRKLSIEAKINNALLIKIPNIVIVGDAIKKYNINTNKSENFEINTLISEDFSRILGQYSPLYLSQRVIF